MVVSAQHCPLCFRRRVRNECWDDVIHRTMDMLYALGCHVHGEAAAMMTIGEPELVDGIECTVLPHAMPMIARCLGAAGLDVRRRSEVECTTNSGNGNGNVIPKGPKAVGGLSLEVAVSGKLLHLSIVPFVGGAVKELEAGCLDFMRLSSSADMVYSRQHKPGGHDDFSGKLTATVHSTLQRLVDRRFCLSAIPWNPKRAIQKSAQLISNGWTMDDKIHGRDAWVIGRWSDMTVHPHKVRRNALHLSNHKECAICLTAFLDTDVVINLACNHNFHAVQCNSSNSGSFCSWIDSVAAPVGNEDRRSRVTCPCCRECMDRI